MTAPEQRTRRWWRGHTAGRRAVQAPADLGVRGFVAHNGQRYCRYGVRRGAPPRRGALWAKDSYCRYGVRRGAAVLPIWGMTSEYFSSLG